MKGMHVSGRLRRVVLTPASSSDGEADVEEGLAGVESELNTRLSLGGKTEEDEDETFGTPLSSPACREASPVVAATRLRWQEEAVDLVSPAKERENEKGRPNKPAKTPRSLARSGTKKAVRHIPYLRTRLNELRACGVLTPACSFFVSDWSGSELSGSDLIALDGLGPEDALSRDHTPEHNVLVLARRALSAHRVFAERFDWVSGIYIGKTATISERFNKHKTKKSKSDEMMVMVTLAVFTEEDIPERDRNQGWKFTPDALAMQYERLLTDELAARGVRPYDGETQEPGGGGRAGGLACRHVALYMLVSAANDRH